MNTEQLELWDSYNGKGFAAKHSNYAVQASQDELGNQIDTTYATKQEVSEAIADVHTHSNKDILDAITAPYTTEEQTKLEELPTSSTLTEELDTKANKDEMSVVAGTGSDADKTTITLKEGTSATVLTDHQDISGKQDTVTFSDDYDASTNPAATVATVNNAIEGLVTCDVSYDSSTGELHLDFSGGNA